MFAGNLPSYMKVLERSNMRFLTLIFVIIFNVLMIVISTVLADKLMGSAWFKKHIHKFSVL